MHESPTDLPTREVTARELDALVKQILQKRDEIEASMLVTSNLNKELARLKGDAVNHLKELGRENYPTPLGTIKINNRWRVNLPKSDEAKAALFGWLRERGIFDAYATVNSNSMNSLYMDEWEAAKKRGEGMEFSIPGIEPAKLFEDLGITHARGKKEE